MNRSNIEWCDFTWNPITGCNHGCEYCYARRLAGRNMGRYDLTGFEPTVHFDRLDEPLKIKKPAKIFTGSMGDLLGRWSWNWTDDGITVMGGADYTISSNEVVDQVSESMRRAPQHSYIVLTKADLLHPETHDNAVLLQSAGAWVGVSITGVMDITETARLNALHASLDGSRKIVSLEPLIHCNPNIYRRIVAAGVKWVIIGGMTGPLASKIKRPSRESVEALVRILQSEGVSVFVKDNLGYLTDIREYPEGMVNE